MSTINPDLLLSEELSFEISSRGEVPAGVVEDKRRQLRNLLRASIPMTSSNADPEQDVALCRDKAADLLVSVQELGPIGSQNVRAANRLKARLEHLTRRLELWKEKDVEGKWKIQGLLTEVREALSGLGPGVVVPQAKVDDGSGGGGAEVEGQLLSENIVNAGIHESSRTSEEVISQAERSDKPVLVVDRPGASLPGATKVSLGVESPCGFQSVVGYNRLPNPLGMMLSDLQTTDGLDVDLLLSFLGCLLRIKEFPGVTDTSILQIAYPYCRSPLLTTLVQCLEEGRGLLEFHNMVLGTFIPGRMRERLIQQQVYRLQRNGEMLASFAADIKLKSKLLGVNSTEAELVATILEAITPEERSRLVFEARPRTFAELERLSVTSRVVAYTDGLRRVPVPERSARRTQIMEITEVDEVTARETHSNSNRVVCWNCRKKGHIRRHCPQLPRDRQNGSSRAEPRTSTEQGKKNSQGGGGLT